MKKLVASLFVGMALFFFVGCGSDNNTPAPAPEVRVDQLGTWNVTGTWSGSPCEGLTSVMVQTIEPLDGDVNMLGQLTYEGTNFAFDETGSCILEDISGTLDLDTENFKTKEEFHDSEWNDMTNQEFIKRFEVLVYTDAQIVLEIEYTDDSVLHQEYTRIQ